MTKKVNIPILQPDPLGPKFGRVNDPAVIMKLQQNFYEALFEYLKATVVPASANPQVAGFGATLTAGLGISVASGIALDLEGHLYGSTGDDPTVIEMAAADPANPRIDLIVATLAEDVPVDLEFTPYRRLRTEAEVEAGVPPYQAGQLNVPKELHALATITVKQGVAAAVPVAPAAGENEVPLWQVRVNAGVVALQNDKLTDVRNLMPHLGQIASAVKRGMVKIGTGINVAVDGTISVPVLTREIVEDLLAASFNQTAGPLSGVYDDANNAWDFDISLATALLKGAMSPADFSKLAAATALNTPSTLMQRNASGDAAVRDSLIERRIVMPDTSYIYSAFKTEQPLVIMDSEEGFTTSQGDFFANPALVTRPGGGPAYYINLKLEELQNVPLCIEVVFRKLSGASGCLVWLYDASSGTLVSGSGAGTTGAGAILQARGTVFTLTGTGRKRYELKAGVQYAGTSEQVILYAARLIVNPAYSHCGGGGTPACPV